MKKNLFHRLFAVLLVGAVLALSFATGLTVTAAGSGTISVESKTVSLGETEVAVPVKLANTPGMVGLILHISYPKSFTLVSVADGGILGKAAHSNQHTANPYTLCWENDLAKTDFKTNGTLVTLVFRMPASTAVGTYPITVSCNIDNYETINYNLESVNMALSSGKITVACPGHLYDNSCDTTCNLCGATRSVTHTFDTSKWVENETHHWHTCTVCGTKKDMAAHKVVNGVCSVCGYKVNEPHTHTMVKHAAVAATHTSAGSTEYYTCSGCNRLFKDPDGKNEILLQSTVLSPKGHTFAEPYAKDENGHWLTCSCGEKSEVHEHSYDDAKDGSCNICGYNRFNPGENDTPSETESAGEQPTQSESEANNETEQPESKGWILWVSLAAVLVLGGGITAVWFVRKKNA